MCREKKIGRMYIYDQHLSICIPVPKFFFLLARTASSLYKKNMHHNFYQFKNRNFSKSLSFNKSIAIVTDGL